MSKNETTKSRWVLNGSATCLECNGRGEVFLGVRHGADAWSLCPACKGNTVIPLWKEEQHIGWRLMREKATGRVIGMHYVADACDGGAWFMRGSNTPLHPDTVSDEWEELQNEREPNHHHG